MSSQCAPSTVLGSLSPLYPTKQTPLVSACTHYVPFPYSCTLVTACCVSPAAGVVVARCWAKSKPPRMPVWRAEVPGSYRQSNRAGDKHPRYPRHLLCLLSMAFCVTQCSLASFPLLAVPHSSASEAVFPGAAS